MRKKGELANIIKTNFIIDAFSAFIACTVAMLLAVPFGKIIGWDDNTTTIILFYCFTILFNITTLTIGIPRLFNKFTVVAKIQLFWAITKLIFIIVVVTYDKKLEYYILVYLASDMLVNLSLIIFSIFKLKSEKIRWWRKKIKLDKQQIRFIWWTNLRTIARIPIRHFDFVIISLLMPIKMVGIYKVYKEIAGILNRLSDPINQAIFPEYAKLIGNNNIHKSISIAKKTMLLLFFISIVLTSGLLFVAEPIIKQFFGVEYLSYITALYALIVLYGINFFTTPINSLFIAAGFAKYSFYLVLFTNSIYLGTAYYFVNLVGIYGIIIASATQVVFNKGLKVLLMKIFSLDWNKAIR